MKVLPVIVLYNTSIKDCESIESLNLQLPNSVIIDKIFVYDNSPSAEVNFGLQSVYKGLEVVYTHDVNNSGVSRAYNSAAAYATEHGYDWLLLLDQDTTLPPDAFNKYYNAVIDNPGLPIYSPVLKTKNNIICSPCKFKFHRGFTPDSLPEGKVNFAEYAPINSCMMLSTEKMLEVNGYNEKAFLDFSDFQFIERLRKVYPQFYIVDFIALQDFSNDTNDVSSLVKRFKIYCKCAKACDRVGVLDDAQYLLMVFLRMAKLSLRTKSTAFFKIFISNYIFKSEI